MTEHSVSHATFSIDRAYPFSAQEVFRAHADPAIKRKWLIEGEGFHIDEYMPAFGIGEVERSRFRFQDGPQISNDTTYLDIVENRRIVLVYTMALEGEPFSASLATIGIVPEGTGCRLTYTEQAAFLDGKHQAAQREAGCRQLLGALEAELERRRAA